MIALDYVAAVVSMPTVGRVPVRLHARLGLWTRWRVRLPAFSTCSPCLGDRTVPSIPCDRTVTSSPWSTSGSHRRHDRFAFLKKIIARVSAIAFSTCSPWSTIDSRSQRKSPDWIARVSAIAFSTCSPWNDRFAFLKKIPTSRRSVLRRYRIQQQHDRFAFLLAFSTCSPWSIDTVSRASTEK